YTGACGALTLVGCDDDGSANGLMPSISQTGLTPGTTVFIRFWEYGNDNNGTFSLCAKAGVPCTAQGANSSCATADPFCTGVSTDYCNTTNVPSLGGGGIYGCLLSTPNPAFYYLNVATSGSIVFNISQQTNGGVGIDVDFVIWGPFASQAAMCAGISAGNIVDCSYSTAAVETATIPAAVAGQWYMVLITNYSNQSGVINFNQTNTGNAGAGATNCNILTATPSACAGGFYTLSGTVIVPAPPATGTLTVTNSCGGSVVINAPFTSPIPYSIVAPICGNGNSCTVTAVFSAGGAPVVLPTTYTAPSCNTLTAVAGPCSGGTYILSGTLTTGCLPATGTLTITSSCGGTVVFNAPFTSPLNWSLPASSGNGGSCTVTAVYSAAGAPIIQPFTFTEPQCCPANAGTITTTATNGTVTVNGNTTQVVLCPGGSVSLISNNNFTLPPSYDPGFDDAELFYAIYIPPGPTVPDPDLDPNWTGYYWTGQDFTTNQYATNSSGGCSPLLSLPGVPGFASPSSPTNTLVFVPITADDGDNGLNWDGVVNHDQNNDGCFDIGDPISITFLNPISFNPITSCSGTVTVDITGGYPQFSNALYTITNTGAGTLSSSTATSGGSVTISGLTAGQTYSISVNGGNGCPSTTFSGVYSGFPTVTVTPSTSTVCTGGCVNLTANIASGVGNGSVTYSSNQCAQIPDGGISSAAGTPTALGGNWAHTNISVSGVCDPTWDTGNPLTICLNILHTYDSDLSIYIQAPNGVFYLLSDDNGGAGDNYSGTCFSSVAVTNINAGDAPFAGSYKPEGAGNNFSGLNGTPINGTWTLWVGDQFALDAGTLLNWSITFGNQNTYTYAWSPTTGLSSSTSFTPTACPVTSTTYTLTVTNTCGCTAAATAIVNVGQPPVINVNPLTICSGQSGILTATGATTYTWSPSTGLSASTGASVNANPTVTTTYTVTGTVAVGCSGTATSVVTVNPTPSVTSALPSYSICSGSSPSIALTPNPAGATLNWTGSDGSSGSGNLINNILNNAICPSIVITYTVTPVLNGCPGTPINIPVTVYPKPTSTFTIAPNLVCLNQTFTVTYTGTACPGSTYNWTWPGGMIILSGTGAGPYQIQSPAVGTFNIGLQVISPTGACTSTTTTNPVTVVPLPTIVVPPVSICNGASGTLNASGATTYTWIPSTGLSATTGASVSANPTITSTYTIIGTNANGCTNQTTAVVTVNSAPTLSTTFISPLCFGGVNGSINLTLAGGTAPFSYLWNTGALTEDLNGIGAGTYTVTVTSTGGCTVTTSVTVTQPTVINNAFVTTNILCN
ncbi:MAG: proprotein convertase P-domain-containing protein, partial [Bacteroidota bacterium]